MRTATAITVLMFLTFSLSCKQSQTSPNSTQPRASPATSGNDGARARIDACSLLTSSEIQSVQGEAVKDTKLSGRNERGFVVSQCFFTLATSTNSISLSVTQKGEGAEARDPKVFWETTFHRRNEEERESEAEREKEGERREEEGEEESGKPQKVDGVGDEAFWLGSRVGGALYVLNKSYYLRVSLGGADNQSTRIAKAKALAQKVLPRL